MGADIITDEILSKIKAVVPEAYAGQHDHTDLEVTKVGPRSFSVAKMYEYVPVTINFLAALAELFGTKEISTDQDSYDGCETCDYGSSYRVTFTILGGGQ